MTNKPKPHIHGRDHEHGGADPTRIHWEDVGDAGAGGGGIVEIVSTDSSVTITDPTGPTVDLSVDTSGGGGTSGIFFDIMNSGGYLDIRSSGTGISGDGIHLESDELITLTSPAGVSIGGGAFLGFSLVGGGELIISGNAGMLAVITSAGEFHMLSGATWVADL